MARDLTESDVEGLIDMVERDATGAAAIAAYLKAAAEVGEGVPYTQYILETLEVPDGNVESSPPTDKTDASQAANDHGNGIDWGDENGE